MMRVWSLFLTKTAKFSLSGYGFPIVLLFGSVCAVLVCVCKVVDSAWRVVGTLAMKEIH